MELPVLGRTVATSHGWLLSTWKVASAHEKRNFKILFKFNENSRVWLVASPAIDDNPGRVQAGVTSRLS